MCNQVLDKVIEVVPKQDTVILYNQVHLDGLALFLKPFPDNPLGFGALSFLFSVR
jgi:hypothetical protein